MFCKKCGTELENGQKFCPKCGQQIGVEIKRRENFSTGIGKIEIAKNKQPVIIGAAVVICVAFVILLINVIIPSSKYNKAMKLYDNRNYSEAITAFEKLGDYKNSSAMLTDCKYDYAVSLYDRKEYKDAIKQFKALNGYKNSKEYVQNAAWEALCDYYPNDKDMKGKVIHTYTSDGYSYEVSIYSSKDRDELVFQSSTVLLSQEDVAVFVYKDKKEGKGIGIYKFLSTEMGIADFDISKYKEGNALDWSVVSDGKSLDADTKERRIDSFNSEIEHIMSYVKSEFRSNGLGVTLSDLGFTSY